MRKRKFYQLEIKFELDAGKEEKSHQFIKPVPTILKMLD